MVYGAAIKKVVEALKKEGIPVVWVHDGATRWATDSTQETMEILTRFPEATLITEAGAVKVAPLEYQYGDQVVDWPLFLDPIIQPVMDNLLANE